jgi:CubicO group peptidase (beta-lactamase class C family)
MKLRKSARFLALRPFAILIVHRGKRIFRGSGFTNENTGRKPDEETIYGIDSCANAFTATIPNRLANDGELDPD